MKRYKFVPPVFIILFFRVDIRNGYPKKLPYRQKNVKSMEGAYQRFILYPIPPSGNLFSGFSATFKPDSLNFNTAVFT
jgi:hypothetical protein